MEFNIDSVKAFENHVVGSPEDGSYVIRSTVSTKEEWAKWLQEYSSGTNCTVDPVSENTNARGFVYIQWLRCTVTKCHQSRWKRCKGLISVKICRVTGNSKIRNKFLKSSPPYPAIIKIIPHDLCNIPTNMDGNLVNLNSEVPAICSVQMETPELDEDVVDSELATAFPSSFKFRVVEKTDTGVVLRTTVASVDDWNQWLHEYSRISDQRYICCKKNLNAQKSLFTQLLLCQHSSRNKKVSSKRKTRSTDCKAFISIKIKNITKSTKFKDRYLKMPTPYPSIIRINYIHNHDISSADAQRYFRMDATTKATFVSYFNDGLTPSQAMAQHRSKLMLEENPCKQLANGSINPNGSSVYLLHQKWKRQEYEDPQTPLEKLKEKADTYQQAGIIIHMKTGAPWAVLVVTNVMARAQKLVTSQELIFLDSSSSCEKTASTITLFLTATNAGAMPICILIQEDQSVEAYQGAFSLLKEHIPNCFGGDRYPQMFMTDDSAAIKGALKRMWPLSRQLLCHFHVSQAEWRWLLNSHNQIAIDQRKKYMKLFHKVMYADCKENLKSAVQDLTVCASGHGNFVTHVTEFLEKKDQWVLLYRKELPTCNKKTNNYAEATIRILKDVLLGRTKAFNVVALVDFCGNVFEKYLVQRILDYAYSRKPNMRVLFQDFHNRMKDVDVVVKFDNFTYKVSSSSNKGMFYEVCIAHGTCECPIGCRGYFCKHQAFVYNTCDIEMPNAPPLTIADRYALGKLALGNLCPPAQVFLGLPELPEDAAFYEWSHSEANEGAECCNNTNQSFKQEMQAVYGYCNILGSINAIEEEWARIKGLIIGNCSSVTAEALQSLGLAMQKMETQTQIIDGIYAGVQWLQSNEQPGTKTDN